MTRKRDRSLDVGGRVRADPCRSTTGVFPRWLWYESAPRGDPVGTNDDKHRAAAQCEGCGEIGIVQVWPDGTLQPLGQSDFCDCAPSRLQVLEAGPDEVR